jgi:hypothetical protein
MDDDIVENVPGKEEICHDQKSSMEVVAKADRISFLVLVTT